MNRAAIWLVFSIAALAAGGSSDAANAPVFHISVYAPAHEKSPLYITRLHYEQGFIRLALSNDSDKTITKVAIAGVEVAPPGCGPEPATRIHVGGSLEPLQIPPHGTILTPARGNPPPSPHLSSHQRATPQGVLPARSDRSHGG